MPWAHRPLKKGTCQSDALHVSSDMSGITMDIAGCEQPPDLEISDHLIVILGLKVVQNLRGKVACISSIAVDILFIPPHDPVDYIVHQDEGGCHPGDTVPLLKFGERVIKKIHQVGHFLACSELLVCFVLVVNREPGGLGFASFDGKRGHRVVSWLVDDQNVFFLSALDGYKLDPFHVFNY
jgi:hypothetical protein